MLPPLAGVWLVGCPTSTSTVMLPPLARPLPPTISCTGAPPPGGDPPSGELFTLPQPGAARAQTTATGTARRRSMRDSVPLAGKKRQAKFLALTARAAVGQLHATMSLSRALCLAFMSVVLSLVGAPDAGAQGVPPTIPFTARVAVSDAPAN